jgi:hypothetical protein
LILIFLSLCKMSTQPDEIENEIEEGEVVTDDELSMTEEDQEIDFDEEDEEGLDIAGLMTSLMATPDGETVCSALVTIGQQLQTQNKILVKILSEMKTA